MPIPTGKNAESEETRDGISSRKAMPRDFQNAALHDVETGIFCNVGRSTLALLRKHATIRTYAAGETVFEQGQDSEDIPFIIALTAEFQIKHDIDRETVPVGTDGPGVILADVELLVRDVEAGVYRRGETNRTLSTVVCCKAGEAIEICPASILWETRSFDLARNVAKLVAIKLLRRTSQSDPTYIRESKRLVRYLQGLIKSCQKRKNPSLVAGRVRDLHFEVGILRSQIPEELRVGSSTKYSFFAKLEKLSLPQYGIGPDSFEWASDDIFMSTAFYNVLMEHPEELWKRRR